ncbi:trigger factor [Pleurocapsa sp. CCALA 161]|uniref:trigger factor n=1 Tax=Pleurocapsa sp. CCALA 161 TaxID=2107688 RepID=UPI000D05365F|nr:trigger factor [Pleurocapsa sp. CCALA 161]PSB08284.1 trigger factor [Pleurocapsa sp. CCALA 161]
MKVTQERLPESQVGLNIEIAPEASRNAYEKMVQNLSRSSNIPGFRKGKVPRRILLQRIGNDRIKAAALEELIQKSLQDAIEQESIKALGQPNLRSNFDELLGQYNPGDAISFSVAVDVPPSIELADYNHLSVKAEEIVYQPEKVDDFINQRREEKADLVPVEERAAQMGDVAFVDFKGILPEEENKEIEGGSATNFQVEIAEGKLIPGMVEGIVGMRPEETKDVSVTFPEDYPQEDLAGKPAIFSITLNELKTKELPELDDDFAQDVSEDEFDTFTAYKDSIVKQFQEQAQNQTNSNINEAIATALMEQNQIDLPESLVQEEVTSVLSKTLMQMQQMGLDVRQLFNSDNIPMLRDNARPEAVSNLQKSLILQEIAKKEALEPNQAEIEAKISEIRSQLAGQEVDEERLLAMVTSDLLTENTYKFLRDKAQIELVPEGSLQEAAEETIDSEAEVETVEVEVVADSE